MTSAFFPPTFPSPPNSNWLSTYMTHTLASDLYFTSFIKTFILDHVKLSKIVCFHNCTNYAYFIKYQ